MSQIKLSVFVFVLCLLGLTSAQVEFAKGCPAITGIRNFNLTEFAGNWYELGRYDYPAELNSECVTLDMALNDRTLNINNTIRQKDSKGALAVPLSFGATGIFVDKTVGTFNLTQAGLALSAIFHVTITDYKNYAVVRRCEQINSTYSFENLWVLSRTRGLSGAANITIQSFLGSEVSAAHYHNTVQDERTCASSAMSTISNVFATLAITIFVALKVMH